MFPCLMIPRCFNEKHCKNEEKGHKGEYWSHLGESVKYWLHELTHSFGRTQEQLALPEPPQAAGAPPVSEPSQQSQPVVSSNGTNQQQAPGPATGDLLGNLIETSPASAASTSPSSILALEAPPPPTSSAGAADPLTLALYDGNSPQVKVQNGST